MLSDRLDEEILRRGRGGPSTRCDESPYPVDPRLVEATEAAIARWGLAGASLNRIADEADMSRATFYRRGVTREQLIAALTDRVVETFRATLSPALTSTGSAADRLRMALEALCATADEHSSLLAEIFLSPGGTLDQYGPGTLGIEVFAEPFERLLRDGAVDGTLREVRPSITALMLLNAIGCGYPRLRTAQDWDPGAARESVIDLLLHGLLR